MSIFLKSSMDPGPTGWAFPEEEEGGGQCRWRGPELVSGFEVTGIPGVDQRSKGYGANTGGAYEKCARTCDEEATAIF